MPRSGRRRGRTTCTACVAVELAESLTRGRPVSWNPADEHAHHNGLRLPTTRPIRIVTDIDNAALVTLIVDRIRTR